MTYIIRLRRGTAASWTAANPILTSGEPGYETDTRFFKVGDGVTRWNSLPYVIDDAVGSVDMTAVDEAIAAQAAEDAATYATQADVSALATDADISSAISARAALDAGLYATKTQVDALPTDADVASAIAAQATADVGQYAQIADLSTKVGNTDFNTHLAQLYHAGGMAFVDWNGTAWPARPAGAGMVLWKGGTDKPPGMASTDVWIKPDVDGVVSSYIAEHNFEGYADGANQATVDNGSGTALNVISLSPSGGAATAIASTSAGGTKQGRFVTAATAGTTWGAFRAAVGMRTKVTLGCRIVTPGTLPTSNMQLLRTRRDSTGAGAYVTAPAIRFNPTNGKFEWLGSDGLVKLTSVQAWSLAVAYYDLEMELDCDNQHMRGWVTPAGGASEAVGDTTTARTIGVQVDEYAIGVLSSVASQDLKFKWLRVADIGIRVNG